MSELWHTWVEDLHSVNGHPVPRRFNKLSGEFLEQLHGFCDASSVAYGVAIYLRAEHEDGSISTSLVTAKARVLPVHPVTIPKAELLGAHLLARLLHHTCSVLEIPLCRVFAWTDSEIVLHWIPKAPSQLDRFVANRVYGMPTKLHTNPTDLASVLRTWPSQHTDGQVRHGSPCSRISGPPPTHPNLPFQHSLPPSVHLQSQTRLHSWVMVQVLLFL